MRQKRVRLLKTTFARLRGRKPYGTSRCAVQSIETTPLPWKWGRCANDDPRHQSHRYRQDWRFWRWGRGVRAHLPSEVRFLKRLYKAQRRAA